MISQTSKIKGGFVILIGIFSLSWIYVKLPSTYINSIKIKIHYQNQPESEVIVIGNNIFKMNPLTHVFEINSKPVIWLYWDSEELPEFAKILVESMICVNPTFEIIIVNSKTVTDYWPEYPKKEFSKLLKNHQADLFRVHILNRFGGVYLDIDTFTISSLEPLYQKLTEYDLVGQDWMPENNILAISSLGPVRANSHLFKILSVWQDVIMEAKSERLLNSTSYPFQWGELMSAISKDVINNFHDHNVTRYFRLDGANTVGQLVTSPLTGYVNVLNQLNSTIHSILSKFKPAPFLYFHLSVQRGELRHSNLSQLLNASQETIFSYFSKCALIQCYDRYAANVHNETNLTRINIRYLTKFLDESKAISQYPCWNRSLT